MRIYNLLLAASQGFGLAHATQDQRPLSATLDSHHPPSGSNLFSSKGFSILTHEAYPNHTISLKVHEAAETVCEGGTKGYSGYLSIGDWKHFYFYYFESRKDAATDPLMMWINGGPGCSSMMGLFMELGPCKVNEHGNRTYPNPDSWIEEASVFFLDQPIGVGFSYADKGHGIEPNGTFAASEDVYAFMQIWYNTFPKARALPFHIAGESYGGHYIPIFAKHIQDENAKNSEADRIPLTSVIIGNGIFDPLRQDTSSWDIACTNVTGVGPVLEKNVCEVMSTHIPRCERLWKAAYEYKDNLIGNVAQDFCSDKFNKPYIDSGLNYYDVSKPCNGGLCYDEVDNIATYLNSADVREQLGIPKELKKFESCSTKVGRSYDKVGDHNYPTIGEVSALLNSGLRVLIYVGTYDWICNFVGVERFLYALEWKGSYGYRHASRYLQRKWTGGETWEFENIRYARVGGAGHMVPYDKPTEALHLIRTWLNYNEL